MARVRGAVLATLDPELLECGGGEERRVGGDNMGVAGGAKVGEGGGAVARGSGEGLDLGEGEVSQEGVVVAPNSTLGSAVFGGEKGKKMEASGG